MHNQHVIKSLRQFMTWFEWEREREKKTFQDDVVFLILFKKTIEATMFWIEKG